MWPWNLGFGSLVLFKLEITCHDGKPDGMLRVERRRYGSAPTSAAACLFRGLNDRGEVFRLSWGRTSLDPLDRYTVGSAMKSASFASQIVHTYIELFLSYKRLFTSTPRRRKIGWSSSACDGDAPIGLPPRAIHFWKALVTRNISCYDSVPRSWTV